MWHVVKGKGVDLIKRRVRKSVRKYSQNQLMEMRKAAMELAHSMRKAKKWSISVAFRWAWKMLKNQVVANIVGVSFGNRQEAIKRLCKYAPRRVVFTLRREEENPYDANAIAVDVTVIGKGTLHMGYLPKYIAQIIVLLLDKNTLLSINKVENYHRRHKRNKAELHELKKCLL